MWFTSTVASPPPKALCLYTHTSRSCGQPGACFSTAHSILPNQDPPTAQTHGYTHTHTHTHTHTPGMLVGVSWERRDRHVGVVLGRGRDRVVAGRVPGVVRRVACHSGHGAECWQLINVERIQARLGHSSAIVGAGNNRAISSKAPARCGHGLHTSEQERILRAKTRALSSVQTKVMRMFEADHVHP